MAVGLGGAPVAVAAEPAEIFSAYTTDGSLEPCEYTTAELRAAREAVTPNVRRYASDYPRELRRAIRFRAGGGCDASAPSTGGGAPAPPSAPGPDDPLVPEVAESPTPAATPTPAVSAKPSGDALEPAGTTPSDDDASAPLIALGVLAGLLALAVLLALVLLRFGRGAGRLAPGYHAVREARWRAGGVWADFRDWLSLGR